MNNVLLVEDEIFARQGLRNLIDWERLGYRISHEADDGEQALAIIAETKPTLVITDIRMPVLDGLELIRTVREAGNTETKFMIISGYGDFKYAQQAIKFNVKDFILKPVDEEELTQSLKRLAGQIENDNRSKTESPERLRKSIEILLKGQAAAEEITELSRWLGWEGKSRGYCLFVEINDEPLPLAGGSARKRPDKDLHQLITQAAAEEPDLTALPFHRLDASPGVYGLLLRLYNAKKPAAPIADTAARLARKLRQRLGKTVMVYVGDPVTELSLLPESYQTACLAMDYKYAYADQSVLIYGELGNRELRYEELAAIVFDRLLEQLEEGREEDMLAGLDEIFAQFQTKRYAPEAVQNAVARIVFSVIGTIRSMQGDENGLKSLEPVLQWRRRPITLGSLKERIRAFMVESAALTAQLRKNNAKGDIAKIKSYIEQHYNEDLNLKSIAARYYMSPVYLGQLFKKAYGIYFNDFLLHIRIHNAKRLLRQTEMRVYEVAQQVGFDNSDYFVSKFEKVEGRTPTTYRNELLAK